MFHVPLLKGGVKLFTFKEYDDLLTGMIQKPDTVPTALLTIRDMLTQDSKEITGLQELSAANEKRIQDLQEVNTKLYLASAVGKAPENNQEDEKSGEELLTDLINTTFGVKEEE